MKERVPKQTKPFTLEELNAWWESESTLALLPKGCIPEKTCKKAHFAITQRAPREFYNGICEALIQYGKIDRRACFIYRDRIIMRNPIEIKKIISTLKPLVRLLKRKAQIEAFERFYKAREHLFRPYIPKPALKRQQ